MMHMKVGITEETMSKCHSVFLYFEYSAFHVIKETFYIFSQEIRLSLCLSAKASSMHVADSIQ